ncbi:MAG: MFS transporter [Spirochaetes bacterium]|nr:MAG: MFS transporter [Spirochaetota bacterium]
MKKKHWMSLLFLGFAGQLAWAVENQFFNTFMFDRIIPQPFYISMMVAASAVTATVTSIVMGAYSDRLGKRKPFLLFGYLIWGVSIWVVPMAEFIRVPVAAAWTLIVLDSVMTFFGSTAFDANYNAYLTDITDTGNRGKAQGIFTLSLWLAMLVVYGSSGPLIEAWGYFAFFFVVGALVFGFGLAGGLMVDSAMTIPSGGGGTLARIKETFGGGFIRENRDFFLVLLGISLWGMAFNIFFPFLLIYLKHFLRIPMEESTLLIFIAILGGGLLASLPGGMLTDRLGRKRVSIIAVFIEAGALFSFAFAREFAMLAVCSVAWIGAQTLWTIASGAWSKDYYPDDRRGEFSGYMTLFFVAFTMIPGPILGSLVIERFGIRALIDGKEGIIPTPEIFFAAAGMILLTLVPVLMARDRSRIGDAP